MTNQNNSKLYDKDFRSRLIEEPQKYAAELFYPPDVKVRVRQNTKSITYVVIPALAENLGAEDLTSIRAAAIEAGTAFSVGTATSLSTAGSVSSSVSTGSSLATAGTFGSVSSPK